MITINFILFHSHDKLPARLIIQAGIDVFVSEEYFQGIIDSWTHCQQEKGLEIYGWCIMPSHIHMIIGSKKKELEYIVRDMKKHTSIPLKSVNNNNNFESRKEWMIWLFERAGRKNGNNKDWSRKLSGATA